MLQTPADAREVSDRIDSFAQALAWQIGVIEQTLGAKPEASALSQAGSPEQAQAVLRQLASLLAQDDAKAERLVADNEATLGAHFPQQFRELRQAIRGYDFERALNLIPSEFLTD